MDKLSEGINKLKDYFTLEGNMIKCGLCSNSYDIILNPQEVIDHLSNCKDNETLFEVSLDSSQDYMKKYYETKDNTIKCKKCNEKLCDPWNTYSIVYYHLEVGHRFEEEEEKFCEWLRDNYELDESNATQHCKKCNDIIINKPISLIKHLRDNHNDTGSACTPNETILPNSLDDFLKDPMWDYFIRIKDNVKCSMCKRDIKCMLANLYEKLRKHLVTKHKKKVEEKNYIEIQEHLVKCNFCDKDFYIPYTLNHKVKDHLTNFHSIDHDISKHDSLSKYLSEKFKKLGFQKSECNQCNKVLRETCSIDLVIHLISIHKETVPPEIDAMRLSRKSSSSDSMSLGSDKNVKYIPTSSGEPKAGSSKDSDTEVRDVDHDRDNRKDLKRKSSDPSSSKPSCSHHFPDVSDDNDRYSGMKREKYDDDDKGSSDKLPRTSSNILDDEDTEGIAASNIDQQSARDEISNTSPSNPANPAELNMLDPTYDVDNDDRFSEIDDQDSDNLNIP